MTHDFTHAKAEALAVTLSLIEDAAKAKNLEKIQIWTEVARLIESADEEQDQLRTERIVSRMSNMRHNDKKARGREIRSIWLDKVAKSGVRLKKVRGRSSSVYETAKLKILGIGCADDLDGKGKWWLGVPERQKYDAVILLCRDAGGEVLDFVLPWAFLAPQWSTFSRNEKQVIFHVQKYRHSFELESQHDIGSFCSALSHIKNL